MADASLLKEVSIKTGAVKRLLKELGYYQKEAEKESQKLVEMKSRGDADEYVVRKQEEILQETRQMIPDCTKRAQKSVEELKKLIDANAASLQETSQLEAAQEQIKISENLASGDSSSK